MTSIILEGTVVSEPTYSYETHREKFYEVFVSSVRPSGTSDTLRVIVPELFVDYFRQLEDVRLSGEVRTRNEDGHLLIYVFVTDIHELEGEHDDKLTISGFICKEPNYRETPFGRKISDVVLASNRVNSGKSDYIPCVFWGRNARKVTAHSVGQEIEITGRLQSREYNKKVGDSVFEMTAYEVSVVTMKCVCKEMCNG